MAEVETMIKIIKMGKVYNFLKKTYLFSTVYIAMNIYSVWNNDSRVWKWSL